MAPLGYQTLTLHLRTPVTDSNGNVVYDAYGREQIVSTDVTVPGCDFDVTKTQEQEDQVTITRLDGVGMLPPDTTVDYMSAVTWNGIKFEVHGPPIPIADIRTTAIDHIQIDCRSYLDSSNPDNREEG